MGKQCACDGGTTHLQGKSSIHGHVKHPTGNSTNWHSKLVGNGGIGGTAPGDVTLYLVGEPKFVHLDCMYVQLGALGMGACAFAFQQLHGNSCSVPQQCQIVAVAASVCNAPEKCWWPLYCQRCQFSTQLSGKKIKLQELGAYFPCKKKQVQEHTAKSGFTTTYRCKKTTKI